MHIELVKFVEDAVIVEHSTDGNKPIYLLGHSFGGCLALSVAARNPNANLVLILSNPGNRAYTWQLNFCNGKCRLF